MEACEFFCVITADPGAASPIEGTMTLGQLIAEQPPVCDTELTNPEDTAVILYTSGTTGFPKGAELSHSNMTMNAISTRHLLQGSPDDIHAIVLPLFHSFGQTCQMNAGFSSGNTLVMIPKFTPEAVLSAIQNDGATVFAGVPTMYWALLNYEDKEGQFDNDKIADTLRIGFSGASSLPLEIIKGIDTKYKIPILEGYGLSETCPVVTFNHLTRERKPGSIGTTWFHTGDLGTKDEDGYFYIVDRVKDMIIRGGYNVYPREIEETLLTHPDVSLASVLGIPHDSHGEEIVAYIVPNPGADVTPDQIIEWSKEQMAAYKYPRIVHLRESLPMTATGKILKKDLRAEQEQS